MTLTIEYLIPIVIALSEVFKRTGKIPTEFIPILSLILGIGLSIYANGLSPENVFIGMLASLIGMGFYDTGTKTLEIIKKI